MIDEILPVHDLDVRISIPAGREVGRVYRAPAMEDLSYDQDGNAIVVRIACVKLHEMVVVEMKPRA